MKQINGLQCWFCRQCGRHSDVCIRYFSFAKFIFRFRSRNNLRASVLLQHIHFQCIIFSNFAFSVDLISLALTRRRTEWCTKHQLQCVILERIWIICHFILRFHNFFRSIFHFTWLHSVTYSPLSFSSLSLSLWSATTSSGHAAKVFAFCISSFHFCWSLCVLCVCACRRRKMQSTRIMAREKRRCHTASKTMRTRFLFMKT